MEWKNISIFISSTFNDMHAERDYLVKYVFPELAEWCEERRIRLVDIDLRWGVTKEESQTNNAMRKCLENIDNCRPFFLCLIGQRRGWVPNDPLRLEYEKQQGRGIIDEISDETKREYPGDFGMGYLGIADYSGTHSITEMEVEHALLRPLYRILDWNESGKEAKAYQPSRAVFFERQDNFTAELDDIHRLIYTNDEVLAWSDSADYAERAIERLKQRIIANGCRIFPYYGTWDSAADTPELSSEESGGVLRQGRLVDLRSNGDSLGHAVINRLQELILSDPEFAERAEPFVASTDEYAKDREQQELFVKSASEGYIIRTDIEAGLDDYIADNKELRPLLITADAGLGKTTLLAHFVDDRQDRHTATLGYMRSRFEKDQGIYRFCGASDLTTDPLTLWQSICNQANIDKPKSLDELRQTMPRILSDLTNAGYRQIVIDAIDQMTDGINMLRYVPPQLPAGCKLVLSVKNTGESIEAIRSLSGSFVAIPVTPILDDAVKSSLIDNFLQRYLKTLDKEQKAIICSLPQSENPLFLKSVLHELRFFGAYKQLEKQIGEFGTTVKQVFNAVLERLEKDIAYGVFDPDKSVPFLFGLLSQARNGLDENEVLRCFEQVFPTVKNGLETVRYFLRQVRPFLARRNKRVDFLYGEFRLAAKERYPLSLQMVLAKALYYSRPAECSYHARESGNNSYLQQIYTDLDFLNRYYQSSGAYHLFAEAQLIRDAIPGEMIAFIEDTAAILELSPGDAAATIYKELPGAYKQAARPLCKKPWIAMEKQPMAFNEKSVKATSHIDQGIICGGFAEEHREAFLLTAKNTVSIVDMPTLQLKTKFSVPVEAEIKKLIPSYDGSSLIVVMQGAFILFSLKRDQHGGVISVEQQAEKACKKKFLFGPLVFASGNGAIYQAPDNGITLFPFDINQGERQIMQTEDLLVGVFQDDAHYYVLENAEKERTLYNSDFSAKAVFVSQVNDLVTLNGDLIVLPNESTMAICNPHSLEILRNVELDFPCVSAVPFGEGLLLVDEHGTIYTWSEESGLKNHSMIMIGIWDRGAKVFALNEGQAFFFSQQQYAVLEESGSTAFPVVSAKHSSQGLEIMLLDPKGEYLLCTASSQKSIPNLLKDGPYGLTGQINLIHDWSDYGDILYMSNAGTAQLSCSDGATKNIPAPTALDRIVEIVWLYDPKRFAILYSSGRICLADAKGDILAQCRAFESSTKNYLLCDCGQFFCVVTRRHLVTAGHTAAGHTFEETAVAVFDASGKLIHEKHWNLPGQDPSSISAIAFDKTRDTLFLIDNKMRIVHFPMDGRFVLKTVPIRDECIESYCGLSADNAVLYFGSGNNITAVNADNGEVAKSFPLHRSISKVLPAENGAIVIENNTLVYTVSLESEV